MSMRFGFASQLRIFYALPLRYLSACGAPEGARRDPKRIADTSYGFAPYPARHPPLSLEGKRSKPRMHSHRGNVLACFVESPNTLPALPLWESTRSPRERGEGSAAEPRQNKQAPLTLSAMARFARGGKPSPARGEGTCGQWWEQDTRGWATARRCPRGSNLWWARFAMPTLPSYSARGLEPARMLPCPLKEEDRSDEEAVRKFALRSGQLLAAFELADRRVGLVQQALELAPGEIDFGPRRLGIEGEDHMVGISPTRKRKSVVIIGSLCGVVASAAMSRTCTPLAFLYSCPSFRQPIGATQLPI